MPFTPETQFDNTRPMTKEEVEDIAFRAASKALAYMNSEYHYEKGPDLIPVLFWLLIGVVWGLLLPCIVSNIWH